MGNSSWCAGRSAPNPLKANQEESLQLLAPQNQTFYFKISEVVENIAIPAIARKDKSIDKVFLTKPKAQNMFQMYGVIPMGYVISMGNVIPAILLFPKSELDQIIKFGIYWNQLTFAKLKEAINAISNVIGVCNAYQYNIATSFVDYNESFTQLTQLTNSLNLTKISGSKKRKLKLARGQVLILDITFKKNQKFRIPQDAYEDEVNYDLAIPKSPATPGVHSPTFQGFHFRGDSVQSDADENKGKKPMMKLQKAPSSRQLMKQNSSRNIEIHEQPNLSRKRSNTAAVPTQSMKASPIRKKHLEIPTQNPQILEVPQKSNCLQIITEHDVNDLPTFQPSATVQANMQRIRKSEALDVFQVLQATASDPVSNRYIAEFRRTSHISAVVQAMTHIRCLSEFMFTGEWKELLVSNFLDEEKTFTQAYFKMLQKLVLANPEPVSIEKFQLTLAWFDKIYENTDKTQDAALVLEFILRGMHGDLLENQKPISLNILESSSVAETIAQDPEETWHYYIDNENSPICQRFHGLMQISRRCHRCRSIVYQYRVFQQIHLSPKVGHNSSCTLKQMLTNMRDPITETDQYCLACHNRNNALVVTQMYQLPPVLIFIISRFSAGNRSLKFDAKVEYYQQLDLGPYLCAESPAENTVYDLVSVVCHEGELNDGTCYTIGKGSQEWRVFNDEEVKRIDVHEKPRPSRNGSTAPPAEISDKDAYILIYELHK